VPVIIDAALKTKLIAYAALAVIAASAVAFLLGAAGGVWVGIEWQQGRQAQRETASLAADLAAAQRAVASAQSAAVQISRDVEVASARLNQHSKGLSDDFDRNRRNARAASALLEDALVQNHALATVVADAHFLRAWNRANAGDTAGGAGADRAAEGDGRIPSGALPARAPRSDRPIDRGPGP